MNSNESENKIRFLLFASFLVGLVLVLAGGIFIRGIKSESTIENRALTRFPAFSVASFVKTDYQSNFEQALSDQLLLGQTMKTAYNKVKNATLGIVVAGLKKMQPSLPQQNEIPDNTGQEKGIIFPGLTPRGNDLWELDDSHHLIFPKYENEKADKLFQSKADNINRLADKYPNIDFYCFYIETDTDIDFINKEINHSLLNDLISRFNDQITIDQLSINTPEEYQNWFFKTDHHWNPAGQKEGYQRIAALLKGSNEKLVKTSIITLPDVQYNGYKSRKIDDYDITDTFGLLKGEIPKHEVYINHQPAPYGDKKAYEKGSPSLVPGFNHYAACYGYDYGLVEYRFNQPEKGNIVVFVESFSNPINELIAAHFNNSYFIDLRHYKKDCGKPFDFGDFIEGKNINQVLLTGYFYFYANDTFLIKD